MCVLNNNQTQTDSQIITPIAPYYPKLKHWTILTSLIQGTKTNAGGRPPREIVSSVSTQSVWMYFIVEHSCVQDNKT